MIREGYVSGKLLLTNTRNWQIMPKIGYVIVKTADIEEIITKVGLFKSKDGQNGGYRTVNIDVCMHNEIESVQEKKGYWRET